MLCQEKHQLLSRLAKEFNLLGFADLKVGKLVDQAIKNAGRDNKRACALLPRFIVWLVIAMALHRNRSIVDVFELLVASFKVRLPKLRRGLISEEAIYHARKRLGVLPLKYLFRALRPARSEIAPSFFGLRTYGIDGTHFNMPDTPKNRQLFRGHLSQYRPSSFPQMHAVFLMELSRRRLMDCCFMPCLNRENKAVPHLLKQLGEGDLLMVDRGIFSNKAIKLCKERDVRFLFRTKSSWKPKRLKQQGAGDYLVMPRGYKSVLRLIEFRVGDSKKVFRLVTDLLDPKAYPAAKLALEYHERWECEVGFKEIKCELMTPQGSKPQTHFRSRSPIGVLQEAWGLAIAHSFIRDRIAEAIGTKVSPKSISFVKSRQTIDANLFLWLSVPDRSPEFKELMLADICRCAHDRAKRCRQYPRVVKRRPQRFKLKKDHHVQQWLTITPRFEAA